MSIAVLMLTAQQNSYTPDRYTTLDWLDSKFAFFQEKVEGDEYGRSGFQLWRDRLTGVSQHQLDQRYGLLVHEVVPHTPEPRNWVHVVDAWCDKIVERYGAKLPPPRELGQKPVPFDYSKCW